MSKDIQMSELTLYWLMKGANSKILTQYSLQSELSFT